MTNGPYCTTGSPIGRPCSSSSSTPSAPASSAHGRRRPRTHTACCGADRASADAAAASPRRSRACGWCRGLRRGGSVHRAPGVELDRPDRHVACRGARPTSAAEAAARCVSPSWPAPRPSPRCVRPAASVTATRGIVLAPQHREVRRRPACRRAGRFSQIWNSSSGLGRLVVQEREHLRVHDARARRSATARRRGRSAPRRRASRSDR